MISAGDSRSGVGAEGAECAAAAGCTDGVCDSTGASPHVASWAAHRRRAHIASAAARRPQVGDDARALKALESRICEVVRVRRQRAVRLVPGRHSQMARRHGVPRANSRPRVVLPVRATRSAAAPQHPRFTGVRVGRRGASAVGGALGASAEAVGGVATAAVGGLSDGGVSSCAARPQPPRPAFVLWRKLPAPQRPTGRGARTSTPQRSYKVCIRRARSPRTPPASRSNGPHPKMMNETDDIFKKPRSLVLCYCP